MARAGHLIESETRISLVHRQPESDMGPQPAVAPMSEVDTPI
jgi:hypothetical protein